MEKEGPRRFKDTDEEGDSSVVTRGGKQPSTRRQREAEVEMKRLMGGAPEVVSTIQANPNIDLEIPQEVVVNDEPWLRPGVIESALIPRVMQSVANDVTSADAVESPKLSTEEAKRREEKAIGETLGNDIWEELQKIEEDKKGGDTEEDHIPEEISQIYGDQTPPFGVLELYKKLNAEKRAEYITDLRIFEEQNKHQETSLTTPTVPAVDSLAQEDFERTPQYMPRQRREELQEEINSLGHTPETASMAIANQNLEQLHQIETKPGLAFATEWQDEKVPLGRVMPPMVPADTEPLIQVETKKISNEAVAHEEEEQAAIDARIAAKRGESIPNIVPVGDLRKERVFGENGVEYADFRDTVIDKEGTPKEWRDKLRETVAWWASPSERLIRRNAELDAEVEKIGGIEKLFRTMDEKYNKLGWKSKIAVGTSLGLGAAFSAGVSVPIALACMSGIAAQRIAGLSTMYLKFEKKSHEEAWGKEKAFLKAAVYTAVMGLAIKEGIEYVSETESAHVVQKWLGEALGHFSLSGATHAPVHPAEVPKIPASAPEVATQSAAVASAPEVPHPAAVAAAGGEATATAVAPEISGIEVTATPGHGYEYMVKRLWEDLHEKGIKLPDGADQNSDLAKLLNADEKTIDEVVHRLAQDNEFFKGDGTSAHINLDSKLTIDTKGQIWLDHKDILAPEGSVTPAYHAGAEAPHVSEVTEGKNLNIDDGTRQHAQEFVAPLKSATPLSETLTDAGSSGTIPDAQVVSVETHEASAPNEVSPANSESTVISNVHNVRIQTAEAHIYGDRLHPVDRFVYGGSDEQQMKMINEYLTKVKDTSTSTVYAEDANGHRVPWTLSEAGDLIKGPPERYGFWKSFVESPNPQKFTKIIK